MKTITMVILTLVLAGAANGFDKGEADKKLMAFVPALDEVRLAANEEREEFQWFAKQGDDARDFVKDAFNDSKELPVRKAALFIFAKGWPTKAGGKLRDAEKSKEPALREFAVKVRAYLNGTYKEPEAPAEQKPADPLGDTVAAWLTDADPTAKATEALKESAKEQEQLINLLDAIKRRGNPVLLPAVAFTLDSTEPKIAEAGLAVFAVQAKDLQPELRDPQACFVWWVSSGKTKLQAMLKAK
ncbi:MAG: hypothetical protein L6R28_06660 [Planctomycetes bacterium]|nr:hypothetical protein [Planctomycetota bacterium]